jgi:type II secretory pathway component GspD/PulD (secretin)
VSHRLLLAALFLLTLTRSAPAPEPAAGETKRGVYVVKSASVKDLAGALARHFKGAAEIVAGPEGTTHCLLVSAPPAVLDEVMKTIEQLDRPPHTVTVEVMLVELPARKPDEKPRGIDEKTFTGPVEEVAARVEAMQKKGEAVSLKRIQLKALEGQSSSIMIGENKPYTTGSTVTAAGIARRSIAYRNLGTQVRVTPLIAADGSVLLDLNVEDSRMQTRDNLPAVGNDEKGQPITAPEFILTQLNGKIGVGPGQAVVAKDVKVSSKEGQSGLIVVVGARIVDAK